MGFRYKSPNKVRKFIRMRELILLGLVIALTGAMFGMTYLEYQLFKELKVQDGRLVSSDNEVVSTIPAVGIIKGIDEIANVAGDEPDSDDNTRRLQIARRLTSGSYTIDASYILS